MRRFFKRLPGFWLISYVRSIVRGVRVVDGWVRENSDRSWSIDPFIRFTGDHRINDRVAAGERFVLEKNATLWLGPKADAKLKIGSNVFIGQNCFIGVYDEIEIGDHVLIGAYSYIVSGNHRYVRVDIPISEQGYSGGRISIEDGVWLGAGVTVLPGVVIGSGAIIGAGSVVTKSIPRCEIWAWVPAKFIKRRDGAGIPA